MDSSVSAKDEICFLRVCHHISNAQYKAQIQRSLFDFYIHDYSYTRSVVLYRGWWVEGKVVVERK